MPEHQESALSIPQARAQLQWVNHLLDADPHNPQLWDEKARLFELAMVDAIPKRQRLERTLLWYFQLLQVDIPNWADYYNYARILRELNRHEDALKYAQHAAALAPDNPLIKDLVAKTLFRVSNDYSLITSYDHDDNNSPDTNNFQPGKQHQSLAPRDLTNKNLISPLVEFSGDALDQVHQGHFAFVFEAADPELHTFQFVFNELAEMGLEQEAEAACVSFEIRHGPNSLTRSCLNSLRLLYSLKVTPQKKYDISPAYPLMEIVSTYHGSEFQNIIESIFSMGGIGNFIRMEDISDFDEQTRWLLKQLGDFDYSIADPGLELKPIPPDVLQIWKMAKLNFMVAQKINQPLLLAYTATTLADFYRRLGESELILVFYRIAAFNSEQAQQWDYLLNANANCAVYFMKQDQPGKALHFLESSLYFDEKAAPQNRFGLHMKLGECYLQLLDEENARYHFQYAQSIPGLSPQQQDRARLTLLGFDNRQAGIQFGVHPVLAGALVPQTYAFKTQGVDYLFSFTSQHELYDSLLQLVDNFNQIRHSVFGRRRGINYLTGYTELADTLLRLAVKLELPGNALEHLESQKNIILNNRLRYLLRDKPFQIPEKLWNNLQRMVSLYRTLVEGSDGPTTIEGLPPLDPGELEEGIRYKLWECKQILPSSARQIERKLAIGNFPEKIQCADPAHTLILEFYPGLCFVIHPDHPRSPKVIELPHANNQECEQLVEDFSVIIEHWMETSEPPTEEFSLFLENLNARLYDPVKEVFNNEINRLVIIPSRMLHVLPLNLLGINAEPVGCLAERYALSFAPSLTTLNELNEPVSGNIDQALFVADTIPTCPPNFCRNPDHDCYALKESSIECAEISSLLEKHGVVSQQLKGNATDLSAVMSGLMKSDIVHFAVHGIFDSQRPENSGLLLRIPEKNSNEHTPYLLHNGQISVEYDFSAVGLILSMEYLWKNVDMFRCRLLNLSACWTGMIDWSTRSDEFYGIANGFLYAGAQNILTCLWPVQDDASKKFNLLFYDKLMGNHSNTAEVLRKTIVELKEYSVDGKKPFESPLFWANYRLIGFE